MKAKPLLNINFKLPLCLDTVFIDTSNFVKENFLEGQKIKEIFRLCYEGHIQLVMPSITYNEILNRISQNGNEAYNHFKSFRDKTRIFINLPDFSEKFAPFHRENSIKDLQALFKEIITSINTLMLDYPTLNIGNVFEKYFNDDFPFSTGEKKSEFPDAFTMVTLEQWCEKNGKKCFVIAADKDIRQYSNKYLKVENSLEEYLDSVLRKVDLSVKRKKRMEIALKVYNKHKIDLEKSIQTWLIGQLEIKDAFSKKG